MELHTISTNNNNNSSDNSYDGTLNREYETDSSTYLLSNSQSNSTFASLSRGPAKPKRNRTFREKNRGSTVYVKKSRFSRYNNALTSILPIRFTGTSDGEMPIDSVGCFANTSFCWTRRFFNKMKIEENEYTVPSGLTCDGADINGKRLAGKFKDELQNNGSEKTSMIKVVLRFCSTRLLIVIFVHMLAIIFELLGLTLFLRLFLSTIYYEEPNQLEETEEEIKLKFALIDPQKLKIYSLIGFWICIFVSNYFKSMTTWINLRTAIRLRNALLGSLFKKCIKSKITYNIAVHQLMDFAGPDGEQIMNFVEKAFLVPGIFIGITLISIAAIILLGYPGIWPLFVIFPVLLIAFVLAKISSKYLNNTTHYGAEKITIVEELLSNFRNIVMLDFTKILAKNFEKSMQMQNRMLSYREIYSTRTSGYLTSAMVLGGLYLNWCDVGIRTDTKEVLVLIVLFGYLLKSYIVQFCAGIQAYTDAKELLERVKEPFIFETAEQSKARPRREYFIAADMSLFSWSEDKTSLLIEQLYVERGHIVGLVGFTDSGKTTFVHSLLGHTMQKGGDLRLKGKIEYYPEEPFIFNGTVKENIMMHSPFDGVRFYNAVTETRLNEDVLVSLGVEDCDIMSLDLEPHQIHRIMLARALYSESGAFIFDEPLRNVKKSDELIGIFQNVMFKMQCQEKTVIIVSCYRPFLEICQKIHYIENGTVIGDTGTRGTYTSFIEMPEYEDVLYKEDELESSCGHETFINGANLNGLALQKPPQVHKNVNSFVSSEIPTKKRWTPMSYLRIMTITIFLFVSNIGYFSIPFAFIQFSDHKVPWLSYICIGIIISSILLDVVVKALYATSCEIKSNKYQMALFEKLLKTSLNYLQTTPISDITKKFMFEFNEDAAAFTTALNSGIAIILSAALLCWANYWLGCVVIVILSVIILDYVKFKSVLQYFIHCEEKAKSHIFQIGTNLIRGRAVIQSVCGERKTTYQFLKRLFTVIECNSTAIYIQKGLTYYSAFLIQNFLAASFMSVSVVLSYTSGFNDSQNSIFFFTMGIFAYFSLAYNIQRLIESLLYLERYKVKYTKMQQNLSSIPKIEIESIKKKQIISLYRGIPIDLKNIDLKLSIRSILRIRRATAQPGEKVVVLGSGGHLIPSILAKIVVQTAGEVRLGQLPIMAYSSDSNILFGFIPHNPTIGGATISMFLDPQSSNGKVVPEALKLARMWEFVSKLPKVLDEPVENLSRYRRQQLCLARCFVRRATIENPMIIIEYPHPDLIPTLRICLNNELANNTVMILASHDGQIVRADEVFETEE